MSPEKVKAILDGSCAAELNQGILPTTRINPASEEAKLARAVSKLFKKPSAHRPAIPLHHTQLLPLF